MSPVESDTTVREIPKRVGKFSEKRLMKKKRIISKCYYLEEGIKSSLKLKILDIGSLQSTYCQLLVGCSRLEE